MMKTVAIVGLAPSTRELCSQEPEGVELWSLNQGHTVFPPELMARFTRWFQIHPWDEMVARQNQRDKHLDWLGKAAIPVYLEELNPAVPNGVRYPYEAVCADLGTNYLTSAIAFMVAMAIYERFEVIKLYGLEMAHGTEYFEQRACLEYLAGIAKARGIMIWVPDSCPLFKGQRYAKTVNIPSTTVAQRMAQLTREKIIKKDEANALAGALNFCRGLLVEPHLQEEAKAIIGEQYEGLLTEFKTKLAEYHSIVGAESLCEELIKEALKGVPVDLEVVYRAAAAQGNGYHPELLPAGAYIPARAIP